MKGMVFIESYHHPAHRLSLFFVVYFRFILNFAAHHNTRNTYMRPAYSINIAGIFALASTFRLAPLLTLEKVRTAARAPIKTENLVSVLYTLYIITLYITNLASFFLSIFPCKCRC